MEIRRLKTDRPDQIPQVGQFSTGVNTAARAIRERVAGVTSPLFHDRRNQAGTPVRDLCIDEYAGLNSYIWAALFWLEHAGILSLILLIGGIAFRATAKHTVRESGN